MVEIKVKRQLSNDRFEYLLASPGGISIHFVAKNWLFFFEPCHIEPQVTARV
jgi:hypothetical protein